MADGRYIMRGCVPDGDLDIANVTPGEIITRPYSFAVNEFDTSSVQELLDSGTFSPTQILRGYDGRLYDGDGNFLAEVASWTLRMSFRNTDYQAAGQKISWRIPQGYSVMLTFTETVIKDARILAKVVAGIRANSPDAVLNFQGVLLGHR